MPDDMDAQGYKVIRLRVVRRNCSTIQREPNRAPIGRKERGTLDVSLRLAFGAPQSEPPSAGVRSAVGSYDADQW
jgi:hypothetical protein